MLDKMNNADGAHADWAQSVIDYIVKHKNSSQTDKILKFIAHSYTLTQKDLFLSYFEDLFPDDVPSFFYFEGIELKSDAWIEHLREEIKALNAQYIAGDNIEKLLEIVQNFYDEGLEITVNLLGEYVSTIEQLQERLQEFHLLIEEWHKSLQDEDSAWQDDSPRLHISMKPSAFLILDESKSEAENINNLVQHILPLYKEIIRYKGFLHIDVEHYESRNFIINFFKTLRSHPDVSGESRLGIVQQAYLKDSEQTLVELVTWARTNNLPITVRLVKGAYWQDEKKLAEDNHRAVPVWTKKADTDRNYEKLAVFLMKNHDICYTVWASHNRETLSFILDKIQEFELPDSCYEFQMLFGLSGKVRTILTGKSKRLRLYCPYGSNIYGFPYVVRRLLEQSEGKSLLLRKTLRFRH